MPQTTAGNRKIAARRLGMPVEEYLENLKSQLKWCFSCRAWLSIKSFNQSKRNLDGKDNRCRKCCQLRQRRVEQPRPKSQPKPPRDGDKKQARARVNYLVGQSKIPRASTVPCVDCGHLGSDRRHEYDHYKGYAGINHLDVQCVCVSCHGKRESARRLSTKSGNGVEPPNFTL